MGLMPRAIASPRAILYRFAISASDHRPAPTFVEEREELDGTLIDVEMLKAEHVSRIGRRRQLAGQVRPSACESRR
jgi:hypothetical protein